MPDPFNHHLYEFGKWVPDEPEYGDSGLSMARDVVYSSGVYQPVRTAVRYTNSSTKTAVRGARAFPSLAGVNPLFFGGANFIEYYEQGNANPLGGVAPAGATHWSFARFGDNVLCASTVNALLVSASLGPLALAITSVLQPRMRYVTVIKTHIFGAYVDDGLAAGNFNPSKFWWSARNSVADWQPGSNRAGFGEVRKDVGPITGVVGFEDFGVLFCEFGVYRIDYVGGDNVWSLRQIGSSNQGMSAKDEDSIALFGTDIYYWSRSGPNVVVGGETVAPLGGGAVRRYLTEQAWTAPGSGSVMGAADSERPIIAWCFGTKATGVIYNAAEEAWSLFVPPYTGGSGSVLMGLCTGAERMTGMGSSSHPLDGIDILIQTAAGVGTRPERWRQSHVSTTVACTLATKLWLPYSSKWSTLHYLRILYRALEESAGGLATVTPTVTLQRASDPLFSAPATLTGTPATQAMVDPNGYITGAGAGLPAEGHAWRLTLDIPSFTGMISSLVGFDAVTSPGSAMY